jgi:hypothetical protein
VGPINARRAHFAAEVAAEWALDATPVDLAPTQAHGHDEGEGGVVEVVDGELAAGASGDRDDAAAAFDEGQLSAHGRGRGCGPARV